MTMRTKLGIAQGLGSAKQGLHHWKAQRITAIALIPLFLWFVISLIFILPAPHEMVIDWMKSPINAALSILLAISLFYHGFLGIHVIIEDYIPHEGLKITLILLTKFASILGGLVAILCVLIILLT